MDGKILIKLDQKETSSLRTTRLKLSKRDSRQNLSKKLLKEKNQEVSVKAEGHLREELKEEREDDIFNYFLLGKKSTKKINKTSINPNLI